MKDMALLTGTIDFTLYMGCIWNDGTFDTDLMYNTTNKYIV